MRGRVQGRLGAQGEFCSEGNKQKLEVPEVWEEGWREADLEEAEGTIGSFLEPQNISLVVHQQQMGTQWVGDPLVTVPELRE